MKTSKTDWKRFDAMTDDDIDYSDIPELTDEFFKTAILVPPLQKRSITLRLDPEIIDFFKKTGPRYQTRMNSVLKTYVKAHSQA